MNFETMKNILGGKIDKIPHKTAGIAAGILAQSLIIKESIIIKEHTTEATIGIIYAFFVLLPVAYYQMRAHETEGQREWI